jgi:hypothetical protein
MFENLKGQNQRNYIIESDSGPGPTTGANADPGRSLRHAKACAAALLSWGSTSPRHASRDSLTTAPHAKAP